MEDGVIKSRLNNSGAFEFCILYFLFVIATKEYRSFKINHIVIKADPLFSFCHCHKKKEKSLGRNDIQPVPAVQL
jgi:hypothetical protein